MTAWEGALPLPSRFRWPTLSWTSKKHSKWSRPQTLFNSCPNHFKTFTIANTAFSLYLHPTQGSSEATWYILHGTGPLDLAHLILWPPHLGLTYTLSRFYIQHNLQWQTLLCFAFYSLCPSSLFIISINPTHPSQFGTDDISFLKPSGHLLATMERLLNLFLLPQTPSVTVRATQCEALSCSTTTRLRASQQKENTKCSF